MDGIHWHFPSYFLLLYFPLSFMRIDLLVSLRHFGFWRDVGLWKVVMVGAKVDVFAISVWRLGFFLFVMLVLFLSFLHALYLSVLYLYFGLPRFLKTGGWYGIWGRRPLVRAACDGIDNVGKAAAYIEYTPQQCILSHLIDRHRLDDGDGTLLGHDTR